MGQGGCKYSRKIFFLDRKSTSAPSRLISKATKNIKTYSRQM